MELINIYKNLPKPIPSMGIDAYIEEKNKSINFSKRRKHNYELYLKSGRTSTISYLPIKLDIENVSRCNYRCPMCAVSTWEKMKRANDMSLVQFKQLLDEQYGLIEVKIQGLGEPALQGEDFFKMIEYARKKVIWVRTTTNASRLDYKEMYKSFIDSDANEIQISIDGASKKTYEKIRVGGKFEKVKKNCSLINKYSDDMNVCRTKMWTLVQDDNIEELEKFVDFADETGFKQIVFSLDMHGWGDKDLGLKNRKKTSYDVSFERLSNLVRIGNKKKVRVSFWVINEKYSSESKETLCPWPFERSYVSSDMRIVPCCMIGNPDKFELTKGSNFIDSWFSKKYIKFRENHLNGKIPELCKTCYE